MGQCERILVRYNKNVLWNVSTGRFYWQTAAEACAGVNPGFYRDFVCSLKRSRSCVFYAGSFCSCRFYHSFSKKAGKIPFALPSSYRANCAL